MSLRYVLAFLTLLPSLTFGAYPHYLKPKSNYDFFKPVVKISNLAENSGGTGSIIHSSLYNSFILTNKHVCELVAGGGIVEGLDHVKRLVEAVKEDPDHDLCLIRVAGNLHINLKISKRIPELGDKAMVVGHPALLPTIITRGHFSEHMIANVSNEEGEVIPTECQLVSATIMPGSSGSPIFNTRGEIAGVVFAGSQGLGYALIIPLEQVQEFLANNPLDF